MTDRYFQADNPDNPHPWYGPCDALAPDHGCCECQKVAKIMGILEELRIRVLNARTGKQQLERLELTRPEAFLLAHDFAQMAKEPSDREEIYFAIEAGTMKFMDVPLIVVPPTGPRTPE